MDTYHGGQAVSELPCLLGADEAARRRWPMVITDIYNLQCRDNLALIR